MHVVLRIWRQPAREAPGRFETYAADEITADMSLLEVLDVINERLVVRGEAPVAFDSDCREGICGACGMMIDGVAHGPLRGTATCQLHMRHFRDGATITLEPWRATALPIVKDLVVDRSALDRIIASGGFISVHAGAAPAANVILVPRDDAEDAIDAAACIGCGACVAACPNGSASLFTGAKIAHLGLLPQGQPERDRRALRMVRQMDEEGFGGCTWHGECQQACPKRITIHTIARMNRDFIAARARRRT
jgi:succinate dehydrogenase / fumarate reductase iron-sulfur subunit